MKSIILAAGEGKRLRELTHNKPKCLTPIGDSTMFDVQVETMKRCGITNIIAVKGYMADQIDRPDVKYYINEEYATTNMIMTLWCAQEEMTDEVIISYGDIIYNDEVLKALMDSPHDISVVVDMSWEKYWSRRFADPLSDAEALRFGEHGNLAVIGQKATKLADVEAGYIGLMKFKGRGIDAMKTSFLNAERVFASGGKPWGIDREFKQAYMTDMLQGMIHEGHDIYGVRIEGGWLEIDDMDDYALAQELFINGKVISI